MAILRLMTVSAGHLTAAVLRQMQPEERLTRPSLEERMLGHARRYRAAGLALDVRLTMRWSFRWRVRRLLQYLWRRGILAREANVWRIGTGFQDADMQYVLNELEE